MERHTRAVDYGGRALEVLKTLPVTPVKNGLPGWRPYVYRGRGYDIYDPDSTGRFYGLTERQDDNAR